MNIKINIFMNNDDFNFNKLSDINSNIINSDINDSIEKQDFLRIMSKDIERLEKIRNNNGKIIKNETKEKEGYICEIDNFINIIREKRKSINNDINNIIINEINYKNNNKNKNKDKDKDTKKKRPLSSDKSKNKYIRLSVLRGLFL